MFAEKGPRKLKKSKINVFSLIVLWVQMLILKWKGLKIWENTVLLSKKPKHIVFFSDVAESPLHSIPNTFFLISKISAFVNSKIIHFFEFLQFQILSFFFICFFLFSYNFEEKFKFGKNWIFSTQIFSFLFLRFSLCHVVSLPKNNS